MGPTLFTDPRILAVSEEHPLAVKTEATLEVCADFSIGWAELGPDYWAEGFLPFETPSGRPVLHGVDAIHGNELITAVSMGEIIMPFPSHVTEYWAMPGVRWLPVPDLPPPAYALVWRTEAENEMIRALAATVRDLGPAGP